MSFRDTFTRLRIKTHEQWSGPAALKSSFSRQLFKQSPWYLFKLKEQVRTEKSEDTEKSEKRETLESLATFAREKADEGGKVQFPGGEVEVKPDEASLRAHTFDLDAGLDWKEWENFTDRAKFADAAGAEVFFVGEAPQDENLLNKMIQACRFGETDFGVVYLQKPKSGESTLEDLVDFYRLINLFHPKLVISLGATVTNQIMGKRERLSKVHGKLFDLSVKFRDREPVAFKMLPLFHPDYLAINPNMKRSAWMDLQKALKFLGKGVPTP